MTTPRNTLMQIRLKIKSSRLGLRNSTTRIPFRYGTACLKKCPQATLEVTVVIAGREHRGYSGDCLPPSWFDKNPAKDFAQQIDDMLRVIARAQRIYADAFRAEVAFFPTWFSAQQQMQEYGRSQALPPLLASFGSSLLERAILDAICRAQKLSFFQAVRENVFGIDPGLVHRELAGLQPRDWLPANPTREIFVRQTVGLGDPLTAAEIPADEKLLDGWPQAIEDYVTRRGVRYFKIKVSNQAERDLDRLLQLAGVLERHLGGNYRLTLDGNEQYKSANEFESLIETIRNTARLHTFWDRVLAIEQPLERKIALLPEHTEGIRRLSHSKPVIIDESDGTLGSYAQALDVGYRGVSSKNCKGALKSLLNAGLTWLRNGRGARDDYLMTGEDLCSVGIIPTQSDLCLVATLGLTHVERNGHHYHPGLSYLPQEQQLAALERHGDFYTTDHEIIGPQIVDGRFRIGSLQCVGFGFDVEPDFAALTDAGEWEFCSLGLSQ